MARCCMLKSDNLQGKVKLVADMIWTKLAGVFSKEVLHCQHVLTFSLILTGKAGEYGKKQLDCAGVATTTLAVLQRLAAHDGFEDLASCCLQVGVQLCCSCCLVSAVQHVCTSL